MKKQMNALMLMMAVVVFSLSGCVYQNTKSPGMPFAVTQYQVGSGDYKIVGDVESQGEVTLWFGAVMTGGEGYGPLLAQAKSMDGDSIMDYTLEVNYKSILNFIYAKATWIATGKAIRYADHLYENGKKN